MADDRQLVIIAVDDLVVAARIHEDTTEHRQMVEDALDALIAAVRAEKDDRYGRSKSMDKRLRLRDSRMTVVMLRDDETSPVAAPCAIAGACQYNEAYENARVRLLNLTTTALADENER